MKKIIIVDLDGTLYRSDDRSHHIEAKDWDAFHEASKDSPPNMDVLDLLTALDGKAQFIAITGRNERYRNVTMGWLLKHGAPISHLYMRPDDNFRPDTEVKEMLLWEAMEIHNFDIEDIWFALEDRDKVVDHWRSLNIQCYQVRPGSF